MRISFNPSLLLCALLLHPGSPAAPATVVRQKPVAPIEIELTPLPRQRGDREGEQRLRVRVTPLVEARRLEVSLSLPPEVSLVGSATGSAPVHALWQAPAAARVPQTREVRLKVPPAGERRVVVTARLLFRKSLPMARTAGHTFNAPAAPPVRRPRPSGAEPVPTIPPAPDA